MVDFIRQFVHPDDALLLGVHVQKALAEPGYQAQEELRLIRRDGQVRWCLVRLKALPSSDGRAAKVLGSAQDITERKQAEQELQRQNAFRSAVVQHAAEGICVFHELRDPPHVVFTIWNDRMTQITGYTLEEINERGWFQTLYPDPQVQARARRRMSELRVGQELVDEEWEIIRADGEKRIVSISTSVLPLADGPRQALAVMQDITERKRVETQLRLQHSALEAAANGIVIADRHGQVLWVNDAFTTLTGYCRWEAVGQHTRLLKSGKHDPAFYRQMWETILAGNVWRGELVNRRKDGTTYEEEMIITPVRDATGGIAHFIAIKQDVSVRRKFEQRLQEQARLLDLAQDAIFVRDLEDRIRYWNAGAERLYGWQGEEALQTPVSDRLYKEPEAVQAAKAQLLAQGHWEGELQQLRKDGTVITVLCRWTLVKDEQGAPQAVLAINTDITSRKALEAQVFRGQRMESIGTLAGGIAHDINNILTPILIAAQMLKADAGDDRKRQLLERIEKSAKRGSEFLKRLTTFARGMQGERLPVDPKRSIQDVQKIIGETFPRNVRIEERDIARDTSQILGDLAQINQVLLNLCVNARDAMPNGGVLTLAAENVEVDEAWLQINPEAKLGRFVMLTVADTGVGMRPEVLEHLFEPFYTTKPQGQGTGLGLATVHGIVKAHGGFIEVKSEVDRGSTFRVFLPASSLPAVPRVAKSQVLAHGQGELILLVDDEDSVRTIAKAALEKHGYRVEIASEGREALDQFAKCPHLFAAAIIDVAMPTMDGLVLSDRLLNLRPQLKILVMTGWATEAQESSFRNLGVRQVLRKPFTTEELLSALRTLIDESPPAHVASRP